MIDQIRYVCTPRYGRLELRSGFHPDPNDPTRLIGWGRSIEYDEHGALVRDVTEDTGLVIENADVLEDNVTPRNRSALQGFLWFVGVLGWACVIVLLSRPCGCP